LTPNQFILFKRRNNISYNLVYLQIIVKILKSKSSQIGKNFFNSHSHLFHFLTMNRIAMINMLFDYHIFSNVFINKMIILQISTWKKVREQIEIKSILKYFNKLIFHYYFINQFFFSCERTLSYTLHKKSSYLLDIKWQYFCLNHWQICKSILKYFAMLLFACRNTIWNLEIVFSQTLNKIKNFWFKDLSIINKYNIFGQLKKLFFYFKLLFLQWNILYNIEFFSLFELLRHLHQQSRFTKTILTFNHYNIIFIS